MHSSAAEAAGGAVAITGAVVVQAMPRSSILSPAIICSRATLVAPVLHLLFFPFPPGFAVALASILLESQTQWVCSTSTGATGNIEEGQTCVAFPVGRAHRRSCAVGLFRHGQRIKMASLSTARS